MAAKAASNRPADTAAAQWDAAARAYLLETCRLEPTDPPPRLTALDQDVWLVERTDGTRLVAKHQTFGLLSRGQAYDLLSVEQQVVALLHAAACPVPRVLGVDPANQFIFFTYCGPLTLDDVMGEKITQARLGYLPQAIDGLKRIEAVCLEQAERIQSFVAPALEIKALKTAWRHCGEQAHQGLAALAAHTCIKASSQTRLVCWLDAVLAWLDKRPAVLGPADYRAANLVIDPPPRKLYFIEFAKIGWDWTERRLVQYTSTTGANRRRGGFRSLLDAAAIARYADANPDRARALDYHYRLFWLNAAAQLGYALAHPASPLHAAWSDPAQRWQQLVRLLARDLALDDPWSQAFCREFLETG